MIIRCPWCLGLHVAIVPFISRALIIQVKAVAPATIWGQQVLVKRKDRPVNDFEAKVISAYLRACGEVRATYSTKFSALDVTHTFQL